MTAVELVTLSPLIALGAAPVVIMLVIAIRRNHLLTIGLTLGGLIVSGLLLPVAASTGTQRITSLLILDRYALFYLGLILAASLVITCLSYCYLRERAGRYEEFYLLLLLATLGAGVLVASANFVSFFLSLEILSVALYALLSYMRHDERSIEAGVKYLVLAATSTAFLLLGIALLYAESASLDFATISKALAASGQANHVLLFAGLVLLLVGIGFKLGVVPFHMWTPDVYEGAPAPVTAFVATISKGAMFALLLRFYVPLDLQALSPIYGVFALIAIASMLIGNLLALLQKNVKRLLAYSSIAHVGYMLVAFLASGPFAVAVVTFYLVTYFVTTLGAFGIVTVLSGHERDAASLEDYRSLAWQHPWLAGAFTMMLLSLAGIPLTAGFIGKFYLITAGIGSTLWLPVLVLIVSSAIGLYYYLRVIIVMFSRLPKTAIAAPLPALSPAGRVVLTVLTLLLLVLGLYPTPLLQLIRSLASSL